MAGRVVAKRNISRSSDTRRRAISDRSNQTPRIIAKGCGRSPCVGHHISRVIHIVTVGSCALLRGGSRLQSSVSVITKSTQLASLFNLGKLVAHVIAIAAGRIHTGIPVQLFYGCQSSRSILCEAALPAMFVLYGGYFATGAATAAVGCEFRGAVCIRGLLRSPLPVISLQRDSP